MSETGDRSKLYKDEAGEYRWKRASANSEEVGASTEGYASKGAAKENYHRINGPDAPELEDWTEGDPG